MTDKQISLAGCIITNNHSEILLIHRNVPNRTQWELPGGKIEPHEQPDSAAIRELYEELNINVEIIKKVGEKSFIEDNFSMNYHWFSAKITGGTPVLTENKFDQLKYFSWDEMRQIQPLLSANTKNLLHEHQQGNIKL